MNNPKLIFAIVIGVVFCFAGYNLWSYFQEQQAVKIEQERMAEERRIQKEEERKMRQAAAEAERKQKADEAEAKRLEEERLAEERRLAREAEAEAKRKENERLKAEAEAAKLEARIKRARTLERIEDVPSELVDQIRGLSAQYIRDNPDEFLSQRFNGQTFGSRTNFEGLIQDDTNTLMLFAAVTSDTDVLQALIDIGLDVNSPNAAGYTPLMFASAYNQTEAIQILTANGAEIAAQANIQNLTALHMAALFNPNPDVIDALLAAGTDINAQTQNSMTPILLACSDNQNLEVVERLAMLGANLTAYAPDGSTAKGLCAARIRGEGNRYIKITDEVNHRILGKL